MALGGQLEVLTQPITDDAQLRAALESIQPGDGHASFGELGRAVRALGETVRAPIDVHLFSDMQRTAMPANFADMVLPANVTLMLHPVANGAAAPNWTVESVDAPAELVRSQGSAAFARARRGCWIRYPGGDQDCFA